MIWKTLKHERHEPSRNILMCMCYFTKLNCKFEINFTGTTTGAEEKFGLFSTEFFFFY